MADESSRRVRGFYQASRSFYFDVVHKDGLEEFVIGVFLIEPENGTPGEFAIREHDLGNGKPSWRLEAFRDSWVVLGEFRDLLDWMAGLDEGTTAEQIRAGLVGLGIMDLTTEKDPRGAGRLDIEERKLRARLAEIEAARAPVPTPEPRR